MESARNSGRNNTDGVTDGRNGFGRYHESDEGVIHLILTVRDRLDFTEKTLDSLRPTLSDKVTIWCIDNGSHSNTKAYLRLQKNNGTLHSIVFNGNGRVPQWEKCYSIVQAWEGIKKVITPADYVGWIDNDMVVKPHWVDIPDKVLAMPEVDVCSLHNDQFQETKHPTARVDKLGDLVVRLKPTANGAFWVMRPDFFSVYGFPPVGMGACKQGVEDWHYCRLLMQKHRLFGVVDGVSEHIGYKVSMRKRIQGCLR